MQEISYHPKISIITPSFNQSQFLEETILSVVNQAYPNLEYIIMDGGSTDGSVEIIKKYAHRLTYWESEPDHGQSHAINKGFKRATGELAAWLNSDDLLTPGALQEAAEIYNEDPSLGFIHGISELIDENGNSQNKHFGSEFDLIENLITSQNTVAQQSTFINRQCLESIGFLDESLHMSMDWDLWLRLGARYSSRFVPKVWSKTRHWPMTKTKTQLLSSGDEHIRIAKKLIEDKELKLSKEIERKALAAGYGRKAFLEFQEGHRNTFKACLFRSLLYSPEMKGGMAKKLMESDAPVVYILLEKFRSLRRLFNCS